MKYQTIFNVLKIPLGTVLIMWIIKLIEWYFELTFFHYGVYPREFSGLQGVIFSVLFIKILLTLLTILIL